MLISVVVCTYNRADLLNNVLQTLCEQSLDRDQYEVIVVDNNSTDHTKAVVKKFMRLHDNVRYCLETKVGLSHARNRGWQEAQSEYIMYTDDDCLIPPEWLTIAQEVIQRQTPSILGGPYYAFYNTPKPKWYKDEYGSCNFGQEAKWLQRHEFLAGNNIGFHHSILEKLGGFDARLGMNGKMVGYGEEVVLQHNLREAGTEQCIYYEPRMFVNHLVRAEQMTITWIIRAAIAKGRYRYWSSVQANNPIKQISHLVLLLQAFKVLMIFSKECIGGLTQRNYHRYPFYLNYWYERVVWRLAGLGRIQATYQHTYQHIDKQPHPVSKDPLSISVQSINK